MRKKFGAPLATMRKTSSLKTRYSNPGFIERYFRLTWPCVYISIMALNIIALNGTSSSLCSFRSIFALKMLTSWVDDCAVCSKSGAGDCMSVLSKATFTRSVGGRCHRKDQAIASLSRRQCRGRTKPALRRPGITAFLAIPTAYLPP